MKFTPDSEKKQEYLAAGLAIAVLVGMIAAAGFALYAAWQWVKNQ